MNLIIALIIVMGSTLTITIISIIKNKNIEIKLEVFKQLIKFHLDIKK